MFIQFLLPSYSFQVFFTSGGPGNFFLEEGGGKLYMGDM